MFRECSCFHSVAPRLQGRLEHSPLVSSLLLFSSLRCSQLCSQCQATGSAQALTEAGQQSSFWLRTSLKQRTPVDRPTQSLVQRHSQLSSQIDVWTVQCNILKDPLHHSAGSTSLDKLWRRAQQAEKAAGRALGPSFPEVDELLGQQVEHLGHVHAEVVVRDRVVLQLLLLLHCRSCLEGSSSCTRVKPLYLC